MLQLFTFVSKCFITHTQKKNMRPLMLFYKSHSNFLKSVLSQNCEFFSILFQKTQGFFLIKIKRRYLLNISPLMNILPSRFKEDVVRSCYTDKIELHSDSKKFYSLFNYFLAHTINKNFLIIKFFLFCEFWMSGIWVKVHGAPFER